MASYIPPQHDNVNFNLVSGYLPPAYNAVDFALGDTGGSNTEVLANFALGSSAELWSESYQKINFALLLEAEFDIDSGAVGTIQAAFELGAVVDTFSENPINSVVEFSLASRVDIGLQSYVDPIVSFALGSEITVYSIKPVTVSTSFALGTEVEVSVKGEPIDTIVNVFGLSTNISATTSRNVISAGFGLSSEIVIVSDESLSVLAGFALTSNIYASSDKNINILGALTISADISMITGSGDCAILSHDNSRWV